MKEKCANKDPLFHIVDVVRFENKVLKFALLFMFVVAIPPYLLMSDIADKIEDKVDNTRIVFTPAIQREIVIESNGIVSEEFAKAFAFEVPIINENWHYATFEKSIMKLKKLYYSTDLWKKFENNMLSSNFKEKIKHNKMSSYFDIDDERSKVSYCKKLKRVCAVVVGRRHLYANNGEPFGDKEVAYFILAKASVPVAGVNPMALRATRIDVKDRYENNYERANNLYEIAVSGVK